MRRVLCLLLILSIFLLAACNPGDSTPDISTPSTSSNALATKEQDTESGTSAQTNASTVSQTQTSGYSTANPDTSPAVPQLKKVTLPEGYTFWQIARTLEANGICKAKDFFDAAQGYTVQSFTVPNNKNAAYRYEGFLFPATYELYTGEAPVEVLKKMLNAYAEYSGMPDYNTLILASVIERETRSAEQMAMISSVFHNRMADGIKLGSDATAEYVNNYIVQNGTWIKDPDRYRALYNTAWNPNFTGVLPAGPICSPGARAINAAKNPAKSGYYYFFFGADNQNHYSKTYETHEAQIAQFGLGY
ncbi:MAG: endolytic transglycosylase MltG [Oscillospiraceae bacterium]|jgi:UPF0755 protein|nr:endolytic transglycosylase MltG [Oscillospiraceae bacterium]